MYPTKNLTWGNAILKVLHDHDGASNLAILYAETPKLTANSKAQDVNKTIRGHVQRLKNDKQIKQVGLGTYGLNDFVPDNNLYDSILKKEVTPNDFVSLPNNEIHGYLQGMLIEIGNMKGMHTYTPDQSVVFNGKTLADIVYHKTVPNFTYANMLKKIAQIDVIWFSAEQKDDFPIMTFDIEHSTDFTKALVRSYQLKYFNTKCYMIADEKKRRIFEDRIATKPFDEMKGIELYPSSSIFNDYQSMLQFNAIKQQSPIL